MSPPPPQINGCYGKVIFKTEHFEVLPSYKYERFD